MARLATAGEGNASRRGSPSWTARAPGQSRSPAPGTDPPASTTQTGTRTTPRAARDTARRVSETAPDHTASSGAPESARPHRPRRRAWFLHAGPHRSRKRVLPDRISSSVSWKKKRLIPQPEPDHTHQTASLRASPHRLGQTPPFHEAMMSITKPHPTRDSGVQSTTITPRERVIADR